MTYPNLINKDKSKNIFEYDGGDLWIRKNVSFWDDQDNCWNNEILDFINNSSSIHNFLWRINYTLPYGYQTKELKPNQVYKFNKDNNFFSVLVKFQDGNLKMICDLLMYDPKMIASFINKLVGLKKIIISPNLLEPQVFDIEEDDWIKEGLMNPEWQIAYFDPAEKSDLNDLKQIKDNIDPKVIIEFDHLDEKENQILRDNKII
jgi:hypothetical protein